MDFFSRPPSYQVQQLRNAMAPRPQQPPQAARSGLLPTPAPVAPRPAPATPPADPIASFARALPVSMRIGSSLVGRAVGTRQDIITAPARATIAPDMPRAREQFAAHPEDMLKGAAIGAGIVSGVAGGAALIGAAGGATAAAGPTGAAIVRTGGGAALGYAARTAPITLQEATLLGGAALAAAAGSRVVSPWRTVNLPTGLPDWMDKWNDPHKGIGSGGHEIPRPDWMRGDPEIDIDPGADWRTPGESFRDYLTYRRELPSEGPPGTGPTPYYQGPEIARPGPASRFIGSPEIGIGGRTIHSPEITIGAGSRTIRSPEIEITDPGRRFSSELPIRPNIFPAELPRSREQDAFKFPGEWSRRPGVDRLVPELPKSKYADAMLTAGSTAIGRSRVQRAPRNVPSPGNILDDRSTYSPVTIPRNAPTLDIWGEALKADALKDLSADTVYGNMPRGPEAMPRFTIDVFGRPDALTKTIPDLDLGTLTRPDIATVTKTGTGMGSGTVTIPSVASLAFGSTAPGLATLTIPEIEYPDPTRLKNPTDHPVEYPPPVEFEHLFEFSSAEETRRRRRRKKGGKKRRATTTPGSFGFTETLSIPDLSRLWRF